MYQQIGLQPEGRIEASGFQVILACTASTRGEIILYFRGQITKEGLEHIRRHLEIMASGEGFPTEEEVQARERQKALLAVASCMHI